MRTVANNQGSTVVDGEVVEVLEGMGLAHVRASDGTVYGINRQTAVVQFAALRPGQHVRCHVTARFHRVLHADVIV